jgi:hypothetical protein
MAAGVFQDITSIVPGKNWRSEIEGALQTCDLFAVFWSENSAQSEEIRQEYKTAISKNKDVVPILLDSTPLPGELSNYQCVDLRREPDPQPSQGAPLARECRISLTDFQEHAAFRLILAFTYRLGI